MNTNDKGLLQPVYVDAIQAPIAMQEQLRDFLQAVRLSQIQNNVPNYAKEGEETFRYIVAFKQCYKVKVSTYEQRQAGTRRRVVKNLKLVEAVTKLSAAKEDDENIVPLTDKDGKPVTNGEGKEVSEIVEAWQFMGWKELRVLKSVTESATERILTIVFDAPKGLTAKNVLLYAIDTLAKKEETANVNGRSIVRKSCELHAIIPYKDEQINTMKTGGGIPARFLTSDLTKFVDLFVKKLDRAMNSSSSVLVQISAKLDKAK